jgi:hypothetical protein
MRVAIGVVDSHGALIWIIAVVSRTDERTPPMRDRLRWVIQPTSRLLSRKNTIKQFLMQMADLSISREVKQLYI